MSAKALNGAVTITEHRLRVIVLGRPIFSVVFTPIVIITTGIATLRQMAALGRGKCRSIHVDLFVQS